jgi:glucuronate isomerase
MKKLGKVLLIILIVLAILFTVLIAPRTIGSASLDHMAGYHYTHRGYHDGNVAIPENSLPSFQAAIDAGYGIELDVQLSSDKVPMVFHDADLMRICGVEERFITGDAEPFEKFRRYCEIFPLLAGNPVYDWSRMELSYIFGIDESPTSENARYIYDKASEMLHSAEFSNNEILKRFHIEYQSPVAMLTDELSDFDGKTVAPSLRADDLLAPSEELLTKLSSQTGLQITDTDSYLQAVGVMLDHFAAAGCKFADHSLDTGFFANDKDGKKTEMLICLGNAYARRGWTLLLHLGAKRDTSARLRTLAGPTGGYAAVGEGFPIAALCDVLGRMEQQGSLPDTVLFPLNMSDQAPLAVMQGSFSQDGVASKVQLGPSWWWCDHAFGIQNTLSSIASFGVVSQFIGMTTDSRSILSFVRHDYFRRLLCTWVDEQVWGLTLPQQGQIIRKIAYENAKAKIK